MRMNDSCAVDWLFGVFSPNLDSLEISAGSLRTRYHFYTNKNIAGPLPCPFDKAKEKPFCAELKRLSANTVNRRN